MPDLALDFAFARPDPQELLDVDCKVILVYTGSGRPSKDYIDSVLAAGIGVCFIQESSPSRSWDSGHAGGVVDARFADGRVDQFGYPDDAVIYYAVSDNNAGFPGQAQAPAITEYARGIGETTRRPKFGVYGNRVAVDAAKAGHEKCDRSWVPSTWGADHSDVLHQMANIAAPLDATDTNHVVHAVEDLGAWTLPVDPTPPPPPPRKRPMMVPVGVTNVGFMLLHSGGASPIPSFEEYGALCTATGTPGVEVTFGFVQLHVAEVKANAAAVTVDGAQVSLGAFDLVGKLTPSP